MDSPPKLAGETLIVHHIPLVHCQVPDRACCASQRANPFCQPDRGAPRAASVPQTDPWVCGGSLPATDSEPPLAEAAELEGSAPKDPAAPGAGKRRNPFLLSAGEAQELFEDGLAQESFRLHRGEPAFHLRELKLPPFHLHGSDPVVKPWSPPSRLDAAEGQEDRMAGDAAQKRSRLAPELMELDEYSCHRGEPASFSFEQEWASNSDELIQPQEAPRSRTCSCSSSELQRCRCYSLSSQSEPLDQQMGYISDSSCNSSDGVLVTFSALYNKMNGHAHPNLNSGNQSCDSSSGSHSDVGAFYLDLHSSPQDSKMSCEPHHLEGSGKACGCHLPPSPIVLDANCNSYPPLCDPCASEGSDLTACFQSQARLVVATQNYYKLVTCDLSSQSSPSPAGSSITSCSEEHTRGSPVQPTEYYLFQRPEPQPEESDTDCSREELQEEAEKNPIEGQVYVNTSPPTLAGGRQRSRSYDRNLERSPTCRLGSLERMMSCPVKLSDSPALAVQSSPPKRVTSFAELARSRKKNGSSPPLRSSRDSSLEFSPIPEHQKDGSAFLEGQVRPSQSLPPLPLAQSLSHGSDRGPGASGKDGGCRERPPCGQEVPKQLKEPGAGSASSLGQKDIRARADGGPPESKAVVRYSKDQRPTTLPIQPFVLQHHFAKQPKARALHSHFASSLSQLYSRCAASRSASQPLSSTSQSSASATSAEQPVGVGTLVRSQCSADGAASLGEGAGKKPLPETTRPSPLGSYSPVRSHVPFFQSMDSSSRSPTPESHPPRSRSCPISAGLLPVRPSSAVGSQTAGAAAHAGSLRKKEESPAPVAEKESLPALKYELHGASLPPAVPGTLSLTRAGAPHEPQWRPSCSEGVATGPLVTVTARPLNANHLSPQALKWREYRRRNPLGLNRVSGLNSLTSSLDWKQQEGKFPWRNPIFELPGALNAARASGRFNAQSARHAQLNCSDFFPDYFSLAEKPPAEFCLSPDGNTESISIDLLQKKGLVKAINTAVDLIVAHFGTSRDPGVKAKLGNSSVSPNVGHLVLKYLCPAIRDVLSDGLKAYVLDVIIGQRRNVAWSVVEASTQLGPSTRALHGLCSKVSQYPELTSHSMRFNAFVFGLLNIRSLEFWFNHLYNHEDIIQAHYQPGGFLCLSHSACQGLFEELLLLLQPLSLLPFSLDLLFEHHLLQVGKEQQQHKELLRVQQDLVLSAHSTLQLMRTRGSGVAHSGDSWQSAGQEPSRDGGSPGGVPEKAAAAERVKGVGAPAGVPERADDGSERQKAREGASEPRKGKQDSWWYQLMQSSQVYLEGPAESSRFIRGGERKAAGVGAAAGRQAELKKGPPPREGVVEGAEACPIHEGPLQAKPGPAEAATELPWKPEEAKEKSRPSWMGSPPDSVLTELKRTKEKQGDLDRTQGALKESGAGIPDDNPPKWGHLFGSRKMLKESKQASRLPSGWLNLDRSVLQLMAQTVGVGTWREAARAPAGLLPSQPTAAARVASQEGQCKVKALCHHIATEVGQLSFKKGDILQVLSKMDADWLRCTRGAESGLVPIMYVTHLEDEDY